MKRRLALFIGAVMLIILGVLQTSVCLADVSYHLLKEIPVGGEEGVNCLTIDSATRRLYVAHETKISVVDIDKETVVGEMTNDSDINGFALVPQFHRGFFSVGGKNQMFVVRPDTLRVLGKVPTGKNPGAILYEPKRKLLYTFNSEDPSVSVYEADDTDFLTKIKLSGKPGFAAADPTVGHVYCNIEDKNEISVIDSATLKIIDNWPIAPGEGAVGMAIDLIHHRLFVSCANNLMVMMDSVNGRVIATLPIDEGAGVNVFDPGTGLAFGSCGKGAVIIAHEDASDKFTMVQTLETEHGGRTMALDPKTHDVYLTAAQYESSTNLPLKIVPDSFKILVYGMDVSTNH